MPSGSGWPKCWANRSRGAAVGRGNRTLLKVRLRHKFSEENDLSELLPIFRNARVAARSAAAICSARSLLSQELAELLWRKPRILDDPAHGECLDRVVPRDGDLPGAVTQDDVLALADDLKAAFVRARTAS
jgi:hypothetical protein